MSPQNPNSPYDPSANPGMRQATPGVWPPTPGSAFAAPDSFVNTSGTDGPIPIEIERLKFNWGAFGFTWLWLLAHKRTIAGVVVLAVAIGINILSRYVSTKFGLLGYGMLAYYIYIGFVGHKLAWRSRRFDSLEQYFAVEGAWTKWFIGVLIASTILVILLVIILFPVFMRSYNLAAHHAAP